LTLLHITILALIQGITEFLPISSQAHLILVPVLTGWQDQGLIIDVAVHVGTLGAVALYFRRDLWLMLVAVARLIIGQSGPGTKLVVNLAVATVPVLVAGYLVQRYAGGSLRSPALIGWTTLGFGVLLYAADRLSLTIRRIEHMKLGAAVLIGLAQVLALVPGTSRSGITMTAARLSGFERTEAARFAMLLSVPVILGAGVLSGLELYEVADARLTAAAAAAAALAFGAALAAIALLMRWLRSATFTPFVVYRVLLGIGLLVWVYFDRIEPIFLQLWAGIGLQA